MNNAEFVDLCKRQVVQYLRDKEHVHLTDSDVYVVWLTKVLQNNKALVTGNPNVIQGRYFEITHDGDKNKLYIDDYKKETNIEVKL